MFFFIAILITYKQACSSKSDNKKTASKTCCFVLKFYLRKLGDSNPRNGCPFVSLANWWFKPLTHLSKPYDLSAFRGANIDQIYLSAKFRA